jgi:hypothetical protein
VGDRGQSLDVRAEDAFERARLGLAQLRELGGNVRDRAVMLAQLHTGRGALGTSSVAMGSECPGKCLGTLRARRGAGDISRQAFSQGLGPVLGERDHGVFATLGAQVPQCGRGEIIVGVREGRAALVSDGVGTSRPTAAADDGPARLALDEQAVIDERVEVPANRRRGQPELLGQRRRMLGPAFEDQPGHRVAGTVGTATGTAFGRTLEFHYTSMTYFQSVRRPPPTTPYR